MPEQPAEPWYAVRTVVRFPTEQGHESAYEERITLWRAASFEEAVERAEAEAEDYADGLDGETVGLSQAYHLAAGDSVGDGDEVFSLIRMSALHADDYVDRFFDTGEESQGRLD